jgi:outer membrane protein assembly factor BamB
MPARGEIMRFLFLITILSLMAAPATAQTDTTITYQGQLQNASGPFTGTPGMEFRLFDSLINGNQIGDPEFFTAVPVEDGLFKVELDFGVGTFDGGARWLEIEVSGAILEPRQKITGSPWSHQALSVAVGSVGSDQIAAGAVGADELATDSLTIASGTGLLGGGEVALGGTTAIGIAPGGVGSDQLADPVQVNEVQAATVDAQNYLQDGQPFEPGTPIIQSQMPAPADLGTVWMRLDEPGTVIWQHSLHSLLVWSVFERNGVVYSGSNDGTVIAADTSDGSLLWQHNLHIHTDRVLSVFERNGVVYSGGNTVVAVTAAPATHVSDGNQWLLQSWLYPLDDDRSDPARCKVSV